MSRARVKLLSKNRAVLIPKLSGWVKVVAETTQTEVFRGELLEPGPFTLDVEPDPNETYYAESFIG
jgi:hypothetical protein